MNNKKLVLDFIKRHDIGVLATVAPNGKPEAAVVKFVATDDFELIFNTFNTYRKYGNMRDNPNVAFVIGWDENITVQYEGIAKELFGEELERYKKIYFAKNPEGRKWQKFKELIYFKITPEWIRYRDGNTEPMDIFEINF